MDQTPTIVHSGFPWIFQFLGDLAFKWVPATIITLKESGTQGGAPYAPPPIGDAPASVQQTVDFLQTASVPAAYDALVRDWGIFVALSLFICLLLTALIIYCVIRIFQIRYHEQLKFDAASATVAGHDVPRSQLRWNRIMEEVASGVEQNLRLAILEADIMLNELLDVLGYKGETMADKMRQVDRATFNTIDLAWEAHRARNTIAHQGTSASITAAEARRIINLYAKIFREFKYIE